MRIAGIRAEDAGKLFALDRLCFSVPWSEQSFRDEAKNPLAVYFLAWEEDLLLGYCGFWKVSGEADITNIAVHPDYRRQGIAKKLLESAIREAEKRGLSLLTLEVRQSNTAAISLYEKYGFRRVGARKRYYSNPTEDALIMTMDMGEMYE